MPIIDILEDGTRVDITNRWFNEYRSICRAVEDGKTIEIKHNEAAGRTAQKHSVWSRSDDGVPLYKVRVRYSYPGSCMGTSELGKWHEYDDVADIVMCFKGGIYCMLRFESCQTKRMNESAVDAVEVWTQQGWHRITSIDDPYLTNWCPKG